MRPIYWGIIWFFIGMVGWFFFSIVVGIGMGIGAEVPPLYIALVYIFGILFFFSLPISIIAEIIRWWKRRREK